MTTRDISRYSGAGVTEFPSVEDFLSTVTPDGLSTVDYNGSPLDFLVNRKPGAGTTIVVFHPAATGDNATRPYFMGTTLIDGLDANSVFVADPSLERDDALKIAWFGGNEEQPLQDDLPAILRHVLASVGARNIIFFGASAGGFASLYYSTLFPGSLAIPVNPQTNIARYGAGFVQAYAESCWGADGLPQSFRAMRERLIADLSRVYMRDNGNTVLYVQNEKDWHVNSHMEPFLDAAHPETSLFTLTSDAWGEGHVPPPTSVQSEILKAAVAARGQWSQLEGQPGVVQVSGPPTAEQPVDPLFCSCAAYGTAYATAASDPHCITHGYAMSAA